MNHALIYDAIISDTFMHWVTDLSVPNKPLSIYFFMFSALPFLTNTQVFLWYPIIAVGSMWTLSVTLLILGLKINMSRIIMAFHYS